jgi:hypothetical protein
MADIEWARKLVEQHDEDWAVGFKDRGLGHGDFAVLTKDGTLIAECPTKEIAEYIVSIHNSRLVFGRHPGSPLC